MARLNKPKTTNREPKSTCYIKINRKKSKANLISFGDNAHDLQCRPGFAHEDNKERRSVGAGPRQPRLRLHPNVLELLARRALYASPTIPRRTTPRLRTKSNALGKHNNRCSNDTQYALCWEAPINRSERPNNIPPVPTAAVFDAFLRATVSPPR